MKVKMRAAKMKKGEKRKRSPARKRKENHVIRRKGDNKFNDLNYYLCHTMSRCFDLLSEVSCKLES